MLDGNDLAISIVDSPTHGVRVIAAAFLISNVFLNAFSSRWGYVGKMIYGSGSLFGFLGRNICGSEF